MTIQRSSLRRNSLHIIFYCSEVKSGQVLQHSLLNMARYPSREVYPDNWRDLRSWSAGAVGQYVVVFHLMNQERSSYFCYFCKECVVLVGPRYTFWSSADECVGVV